MGDPLMLPLSWLCFHQRRLSCLAPRSFGSSAPLLRSQFALMKILGHLLHKRAGRLAFACTESSPSQLQCTSIGRGERHTSNQPGSLTMSSRPVQPVARSRRHLFFLSMPPAARSRLALWEDRVPVTLLGQLR